LTRPKLTLNEEKNNSNSLKQNSKKEEEKDKVLRINKKFIKSIKSSILTKWKISLFHFKIIRNNYPQNQVSWTLPPGLLWDIFNFTFTPVKGENPNSYPNPFWNHLNRKEIQEEKDPSLKHLHYRHILIHHFSILIVAFS